MKNIGETKLQNTLRILYLCTQNTTHKMPQWLYIYIYIYIYHPLIRTLDFLLLSKKIKRRSCIIFKVEIPYY